MTPPPITSAGNRTQRPTQAGSSLGHPRRFGRRAAPSAPRRVSGPAAGRSAAPRGATTPSPDRVDALFAGAAEATYSGREAARATATRERPSATRPRGTATRERPSVTRERPSVTRERPSVTRKRPSATRKRATAAASRERATVTPERPNAPRERRYSGPAAPPKRAARPRPQRRGTTPLTARAAAFARSIPDHSLLDRVVRGRAWIPLLGAMLLVIVAMQVSLLQLGAGTGAAIERAATLTAQNQALRARVGTLADDQRIEGLAAGMGMVMPAPTAVTFLSGVSTPSPAQAAAAIAPPAPTTWEAKQTTGSVSLPVLPTSTTGTTGSAGAPTISGSVISATAIQSSPTGAYAGQNSTGG